MAGWPGPRADVSGVSAGCAPCYAPSCVRDRAWVVGVEPLSPGCRRSDEGSGQTPRLEGGAGAGSRRCACCLAACVEGRALMDRDRVGSSRRGCLSVDGVLVLRGRMEIEWLGWLGRGCRRGRMWW